MGAALEPEEAALLAAILQKPELLRNGEQALCDYTARIRRQKELADPTQDLLELQRKLKETKGYEV